MIHELSKDAKDDTDAARFSLAEMVSKALFAIYCFDLNFSARYRHSWTTWPNLGELSKHLISSSILNIQKKTIWGTFPELQMCVK